MPNRTDNFDRANNAVTMGTPSDAGSDWTYPTLAHTWGIASNRAYYTGTLNTAAVALMESGLSDCDIQVTLPTVYFAGSASGLAFRAVDTGNCLVLSLGGSTLSLLRFAGGLFTSKGSFNGTTANGDTFRVHCEGSQISVYQNEVLRIGPITETTYATETKHGLYAYEAAHNNRWDNFSVTGLPVGPTSATVSGPTGGVVSTESTAFTVTLNAPSVGTTTVNLASTDGGDVFHATSGGSTVSSIDIADGQTVGTFYLLPDSTVGARTITPTASGITFTPTSLTYTTTPPALVAGTASFVSSGPSGIVVSATDASGGAAPYTYQWQRNSDGGSYSNLTNGGGVSGATTLELTDGSAVEGVLYRYRLVYTDSDTATATSNAVTAQVYSGGPLTGGTSGPSVGFCRFIRGTT